MIEFKNIYKSYNDKNVINNLNLVIMLREIVGLIGHNVAGKTTTLKMLTGILKSDKGEILINKKDI
ncbi:ATP-binding cassette domain-containing protein (plasmid) [Sarcina sp. JB2]|uniref:ATP-binding cassette domain-containing protein n=1 Tax=Candidatus Sarcina troglodytae TaxID=2726954 RepID=A0ACD1BGJ9_9CLOT|nr:ATP-binding cassette domain-containing protein [Sarcina sp. JB2]QPJ86696.1 ATP-binding cassette domain-containing protein [Sarcina sp. JB2]